MLRGELDRRAAASFFLLSVRILGSRLLRAFQIGRGIAVEGGAEKNDIRNDELGRGILFCRNSSRDSDRRIGIYHIGDRFQHLAEKYMLDFTCFIFERGKGDGAAVFGLLIRAGGDNSRYGDTLIIRISALRLSFRFFIK